jgi:hypothetical protein
LVVEHSPGFFFKENQDVTPAFVSKASVIIFGLVVGVPILANAETAKVMDKASTDGSFTIAQTNGQNRRDTRQDCRQQEGAGADKRNCKQEAR